MVPLPLPVLPDTVIVLAPTPSATLASVHGVAAANYPEAPVRELVQKILPLVTALAVPCSV